jgi:arsenate reductase
MAEGFARTYGSDVMLPASAGLSPALHVAPDTVRAMEEKNIDLRQCFPKSLRQFGKAEIDIVVNMSGLDLPLKIGGRTITWAVDDPVSLPYKRHCEVRDRIERLVMELVLELRREGNNPQFRSLHTGR